MANKKYTFYVDSDGNTSEDAIDSPYGTVTLTMSANGTVKAAGSFVTGTNAKTGKDVVYKASGSTVLTPIDETTYRVFVYFPPKGAFVGYAKELRLVWDGEKMVCKTVRSGVSAKISKHTDSEGWETWYWIKTVTVKRGQAHTFWIKNLTENTDISGMYVYYTYKYKEDGEVYEDRYYASESCENDDGTEKYVLLTAEDWEDIPGTGSVTFTVRVDGWEPESMADATFTFGHSEGDCDYPRDPEPDPEEDSGHYACKPVVYLYPETDTSCRVALDLDGKLTCTYPDYGVNGWANFIASPDGTLTFADGQQYYCLFWEGETHAEWDFSQGYCVKGTDTAAFLADVLLQMGLSFREANEFIIYWLPLMQDNPYNIIAFQGENYINSARLSVDPQPESVLRVFMAWKPSDYAIDIPAPVVPPFERKGFTVVEWGGTKVQ